MIPGLIKNDTRLRDRHLKRGRRFILGPVAQAYQLLDQFLTNAGAPLTSPRTCEPGPGEIVITDTENKLSIASQQLVCAGGKGTPAWGDPGWYGRHTDDTGFARAHYFQFDFKVTTAGYAMFGWSNSTTLALANLKHAFFHYLTRETEIRDQADTGGSANESVSEFVTHTFDNVTYTVRIYAMTGGGALWLIKGGHWGADFKTLAYSLNQNDATIYPSFLGDTAADTMDNCLVVAGTRPALYVCYYNGTGYHLTGGNPDSIGSPYAIGRGVSWDNLSVGREVENPVLQKGTGWEGSYVKDPAVLKDGSTYKIWYTGSNGTLTAPGYATSADGLAWTKYAGNPVTPLSSLAGDAFNRADSASSLGVTDIGGLSWVADVGTWGVTGKKAYLATSSGAGPNAAYVDVGTADVVITMTLAAWQASDYPRLIARYTDIGNHILLQGSNTAYQLYKRVANTYTQLGSDYTYTPTAGDVIKLVCSGNNFTVYVNGVSRITATDSFNNTVTKHGISVGGNATTPRFANFSIGAAAEPTFDWAGSQFPVVFKDGGAVAAKRWKMLYSGIGLDGKARVGYAYSADGIAFAKGAANPVVDLGTAGAFDDVALIAGSLVLSSGTYYFFYGGRHTAVSPMDDQVGLVTFTDFEGTYTKSGKVLSNRTGNQALTANTLTGSAVVTVADTSVFVANEVVCLMNNHALGANVALQQNKVQSIDSPTQLTLVEPAFVDFNTADTSHVLTQLQALTPRSCVLENGRWKMWLSAFQVVGVNGNVNAESTYYATSSAPDSGWAFDHVNSPPLWLPVNGRNFGWDADSAENICFVLDADTNARITI